MPGKTTTKAETLKTPPLRPRIHKINDILSTVFYILWIVIGAFFVLVIIGEIRQGALQSLMGSPRQQQASNTPTSAATETELPGIGTVNIECVKNALSTESIQKLLQDGSASGLTADEKTKFEPCVVALASPNPSASPTK